MDRQETLRTPARSSCVTISMAVVGRKKKLTAYEEQQPPKPWQETIAKPTTMIWQHEKAKLVTVYSKGLKKTYTSTKEHWYSIGGCVSVPRVKECLAKSYIKPASSKGAKCNHHRKALKVWSDETQDTQYEMACLLLDWKNIVPSLIHGLRRRAVRERRKKVTFESCLTKKKVKKHVPNSEFT